MKIVLATDGDEFGGAEKSIVNLVNEIGSEFELELLGRDCLGMRELSIRLPGLKCTLVPGKPKSVVTVARLMAAIRRNKPDIVQVTLCNPGAGRDMQIAAILVGIPVVAIEQLVYQLPRNLGWLLKRLTSRLLTDHVSVGRTSAHLVEKYFVLPKGSVRTIYNGIPVPSHIPLKQYNGRVVGCVARLEQQKAIDLLISSIAAIPDVQLLILGEGSLRSALESQVYALGIEDRVEFLGWVEEPMAVMASFDVFVLSSRAEAFPLSIVEAMLMGIPVVATDVGSVAESVEHRVTGLLAAKGDVVSLTNCIEEMLFDKGLAASCAINARSLALNKFTASSMATAYRNMWCSPRGSNLFRR